MYLRGYPQCGLRFLALVINALGTLLDIIQVSNSVTGNNSYLIRFCFNVRLRVDKEMADIVDYIGRQMIGHFTVQHENRKQKISVQHRL